MQKKAIFFFTVCSSIVRLAHAGDPEAHTAAAVQAAVQVAGEDEFKSGVGAPRIDGVPQQGRFVVPANGRADCPYQPYNGYGEGCAYTTLEGQAVNEPDNWTCLDKRQPEIMTSSNAAIGPGTTLLAHVLAARISEVAMVCNWNHFNSNPILPANPNMDSRGAFKVIQNWSKEILDQIKEGGATAEAACDAATFEKYTRRIFNAMHYTQDSVCEHHKEGNSVCSNIEIGNGFSMNPLYDFAAAHGCMAWLKETINGFTGAAATGSCDEAVVRGVAPTVNLNCNMRKVAAMCGLPIAVIPDPTDTEGCPVPSVSIPDPLASVRTPSMSLACMGLERTFRHHCLLDTPKTLVCQGPASDHSDATTDNKVYCEGERFPAPGGDDFLAKATMASVPVLEEGFRAWADVCKEPDDPCDPDQCKTWCQRTRGKAVDGEEMTGYCLNKGEGDAECHLHECLCTFADDCGATGQQCCQTETPCRSSDDECGRATGTCVAKGTDSCKPEFSIELVSIPPQVPTDETVGFAAHVVEPLPMGTEVRWNWEMAGVGSIQALEGIAGDANRESSQVKFSSGSTEGVATFNASAYVTPPNKGVVLAISPNGTTNVVKGLKQIVMQASGGVFACSDTKACGVSEYGAYIVPRFEKAISYTAVLSGFGYPSCNRTVTWNSPKADGGDCDFPISYHPHTSAGPTDLWAVWTGFGGPWDSGPKCEVTITLAP